MNNKRMKYNMHTIMSCHVKVNEENRTWKEKAELGRLFTFDEQALQSITLSEGTVYSEWGLARK